MRIVLGSINECKLQTTRQVLADYPRFSGAEIVGVEVDSGVGEQPLNLETTIRGAINRAKAAFTGCDFSIGIEGGTMEVSQSGSGTMKLDVCAMYDGNTVALGFSSAFSLP